MRLRTLVAAFSATAVAALVVPAAADVIDPIVSSNEGLPFPEDAENEPALALDRNPARKGPWLFAGANDYHDQSVCIDSPCAFKDGVGISGVYFSQTGTAWEPGSYPGTTGTGASTPGTIRTLPKFSRKYWSRGDPSLAATARPIANGGASVSYSWTNGTRVYYATLVAGVRDTRRIAVSWSDPTRALAAGKPAWGAPRFLPPAPGLVDRPAVWADNARSSPNFGNVYVCWTTFPEAPAGKEPRFPTPPGGPIGFSRSVDGGRTWSAPKKLSGLLTGRHGCAIRTDSTGRVYVFWEELGLTSRGKATLTTPTQGEPCGRLFRSQILMAMSTDGEAPFSTPKTVTSVVEPGFVDVRKGAADDVACAFDGAAGARTNAWPAVDIANGAPLGGGPDTIAVAWTSGVPNRERVLVRVSRDRGATWGPPRNAANTATAKGAKAPDRPVFPAVALAPSGTHLYVVYTAFFQPWQKSLARRRQLQGVVRVTRLVDFEGTSTAWGEVRGPFGDARGSSNPTLTEEFLGDYNAVVATNKLGYAAWTDASYALQCDDVDTFRTKGGEIANLSKACPPEDKNPDGSAKAFGNVTICAAGMGPSAVGKPITYLGDCTK
jgi:hypothetical protein